MTASATLVSVSWSHGKYDSYELSRDGVFTGTIHPSGYAFMVSPQHEKTIARDFQFISCRNIGSTLGAICASIPKPFLKMKPSSRFHCDLLYYRGIHYGKLDGIMYHLYHKWNNCITPYSCLLEFFKAHKDNLRSFLHRGFRRKLQKTAVSDTNLRFINQISG